MGYAKKCTRCGAYLDPQEKNDPCDDCIEELKRLREEEAKKLVVVSEKDG